MLQLSLGVSGVPGFCCVALLSASVITALFLLTCLRLQRSLTVRQCSPSLCPHLNCSNRNSWGHSSIPGTEHGLLHADWAVRQEQNAPLCFLYCIFLLFANKSIGNLF